MQNDNINKKSKRVSMRDIAEKLGISKVSVCLALNGAKNVSEQTRKKVFETENIATDLYALSLEKPFPRGMEYTRKIIKTEWIQW